MKPPNELNVLDAHGGFTTISPGGIRTGYQPEQIDPHAEHEGRGSWASGDGPSLWCPGSRLKRTTIGALVSYREDQHYQTIRPCTRAVYRVPGFAHPVLVWWDATGKRLA